MAFLMVLNGHTGVDDDGVWFEGTVEQFDDSFPFTDCTAKGIHDFAAREDSYIKGEIVGATPTIEFMMDDIPSIEYKPQMDTVKQLIKDRSIKDHDTMARKIT